MNVYEKLWNEKKRELAEKISKAPNSNVAAKKAIEKEVAEVIKVQDFVMDKKEEAVDEQ